MKCISITTARPERNSFSDRAASPAPGLWKSLLPHGTSRCLRGANVIVSTGTRAAWSRFPVWLEAQPLTHIEALELDQVPGHLLVIGGGYVGLELSQAMRRLAAKSLLSIEMIVYCMEKTKT